MITIDSNTLSVLTTLLIDVVGASVIFLGFICLRSLRGDKELARDSTLVGIKNINVHEV
jgi:hypothetical protein